MRECQRKNSLVARKLAQEFVNMPSYNNGVKPTGRSDAAAVAQWSAVSPSRVWLKSDGSTVCEYVFVRMWVHVEKGACECCEKPKQLNLEMSNKRKYNEAYLSFGFTFIAERDRTQKPQCFLCGKVLANGSMKPTKLKEHLMSVHPENASGSVDLFRAKKARFEKAGTLPKLGFAPTQKPCLEASYKVAYRIAKQKKPHTFGETLVKPCALEMVELVCGLEQRKKIAAVPLSNDVIHSRIVDISSNILKQVMEELAATSFLFSMQLNETTDVSQCSQLLVFVRYMHADAIKEEFIFCEPLLETTKAIDTLEMVNSFFAKQNFDWKKNLGTLCTDGAPAMLGNPSGFATLVKKEAPQRFRQEMGAEYEVLLYHTEVRWLSRGQILKRLIELRAEVSLFLREKESSLSEQFDSEEFIHGLAYLADIFGHMNEVNLAIHGPKVTIIDATERQQAFPAKLPLWKRMLEADNYANFPLTLFKGYFCSGDVKVETWIRNPFLADIDCMSDEDLAKDDLIDLKTKEMLRNEFNSKSLGEFWCALTQAYPRLVKRAMGALIPASDEGQFVYTLKFGNGSCRFLCSCLELSYLEKSLHPVLDVHSAD
ncbi:protein ZBED8-like [Homarus americanus]|uniref:protein ZBED8-like n=1 Tax=Homarus americanus TaxID=6706 RepID=UPI001C4939A1|nr:protein ZBED8-like [Homarus americanus]